MNPIILKFQEKHRGLIVSLPAILGIRCQKHSASPPFCGRFHSQNLLPTPTTPDYSLHLHFLSADVAELADALDSKSGDRKVVWVRPPPSVPFSFFKEFALKPRQFSLPSSHPIFPESPLSSIHLQTIVQKQASVQPDQSPTTHSFRS
jgi:hypothetical protein